MAIQKPKTIGHYWKLKQEQEILTREAKKKADCLRGMELDWARIKGKLAKLNTVLDPYEVKNVPIEIVREG